MEYEAVPRYCKHCRLLGHSIAQCRALEKKKQAESQEKDGGKEEVNDKGTEQAEVSKEKSDNTMNKT